MEDVESDEEFTQSDARQLVLSMNRKKKKSGGFQVMGFSRAVFNGLLKKGYKLPTPIQRKTIPVILAGRDVVAMARTGSGKTAAFLLPMFEKLQRHTSTGPRALIISPTRELALQTLSFTKELGKFTDLTTAVILGGERMEDQFAALHSNPDIIIATPGRLLHVIMEMSFSLKSIEYVVFDEGDRLFELGFSEQLSETLHRLPRDRQTLIFSATLPSNLVEFVRAGLSDPILIRLDVDAKLNQNLKLAHITCLPDEKNAILLFLLQHLLGKKQSTMVFFATKHHVEFFQSLLNLSSINCGAIHSGLDPSARNLAIKQFRTGRIRILLATDVAARGVDIPLLDAVINFHFPSQPKLFLHRVGRVARAGRIGTAFSLIDSDELPYLFDTFVFLGKTPQTNLTPEVNENELLGRAPRSITSGAVGMKSQNLIAQNSSLESMIKVCSNATKRYLKTRPKASSESVKRAKRLRGGLQSLPIHPIFPEGEDESNLEILACIRNRKLPTIFEALGRQANPAAYETMMKRKRTHGAIIARHASFAQRMQEEDKPSVLKQTASSLTYKDSSLGDTDMDDLTNTPLFIPYSRSGDLAENGLKINQSVGQFSTDAASASFDLMNDELSQTGRSHIAGSRLRKQVWDRKRKRYVNADAAEGKANLKRIKTESGIWIPASYKTDMYTQWLKRSHADQQNPTADEDEGPSKPGKTTFSTRFGGVVEFPDEPNTATNRKMNKSKKNESSGGNVNPTGGNKKHSMKVMGIQPWYHRATAHQKERKQIASDAQRIRQPKGSRTFGQLRKPEQVLKLRRRREKMNQKKKPQPQKKGGKIQPKRSKR